MTSILLSYEGLSDDALRHNAQVDVEVARLRKIIDDAGLKPAERDAINHALNSRFFYARLKPEDRRRFDAVQGVFARVSEGAEEFMRKKINQARER